MKYLILLFIALSISSSFTQKEKELKLSDSSQILVAGQKIQLEHSSFGTLYFHVFEYQEVGPMNHVNLTDQQNGLVMKIESFKLLKENGVSIWLAILNIENDNKTYVCEIEEAITTGEIKLL